MRLKLKKLHFKDSFIKKAFQSVAFYSAFIVFGGLGLASSLVCLILTFFLHGRQTHYFGQKLIHRLFAFFIGYVRFFGLVHVDAVELARLSDSRGVIFVANHPSLLDVVVIIAQMPRMICLMKSSLRHNVVLSGQARLAGYVDSKSNSSLIKSCRDELLNGGNLLVFPEGTRSKQTLLGPFKMGFATIAKASQSPVQTIIVKVSGNCLGKTSSFLMQPALPIRCSVRLGERFVIGENEDARSFGRRVESYYQAVLNKNDAVPCQP